MNRDYDDRTEESADSLSEPIAEPAVEEGKTEEATAPPVGEDSADTEVCAPSREDGDSGSRVTEEAADEREPSDLSDEAAADAPSDIGVDSLAESPSDNAKTATSLPVPTEQDKKKSKKDGEPKPRGIDSRFDLAELFIFSLVAVLLLSAFIFRHTVVDGGSMDNTLHDGENLIISDLFYTPKTGDIIVFEDYHTPFRKPLIKRVIATGGQTVAIVPTGVYVDGSLLEEDYVHTAAGYRYTPMTEFTVPEGMIFVMGDHRDNSTDSRSFGCISEESVLGRVLLRYFPFSRFGTVD